MDQRSQKLLTASGAQLVEAIGIDVIRNVVLDVMCGRNLRDSTEMLTRKRLGTLNLALVELFVSGSLQDASFIKDLTKASTDILLGKKSKESRWLSQWILGLTDKAFQNVLRDNRDALAAYADGLSKVLQEVSLDTAKHVGELSGHLQIGEKAPVAVNWLFMAHLMTAAGAQTLAIRGSEKSAYGKLFERLILGSLLHILGFEFVTVFTKEKRKNVFRLSEPKEKRESDATLLYEIGKGVRFDIGFIGRGNSEISLDKVTRFEHEMTIDDTKHFMGTIILVDRIGEASKIEELAARVNGKIIQMSMAYWPREVAKELSKTVGYSHDILKMSDKELSLFLDEGMKSAPLATYLKNVVIDED